MHPSDAFNLFGYVAPDQDKERAMVQLRTRFGELAKLWVQVCEDEAEQRHGLRKLREASTAMIGGLLVPFPREDE